MQKDLVGQRIGNYELVKLMGKGGMGEVYAAHHPVLDRQVAVKVLSRALSDDEELVARFRQEAQAANRIGHDAIVEVTDFGVLEDERFYYVMELLQGMSLQDYLDEHGPVTVAEAVTILRPILEALAAAHEAGIVHRDIKPDNIFLHRDRKGNFQPKLLDFGIAKLTDPTGEDSGVATRTGQLLGTPMYMSPEQASGESASIGPWSDVYSVAAVLFKMLTGKPPYEAKSFGALLLKHMQDPPPDLSAERPDLPAALGDLIKEGMAKTPDERHKTVRSFLDQLQADAPETEATLPGLPVPDNLSQLSTDPTLLADSVRANSATALASTTPASLSRGDVTGPGAESVSATGRTSLSQAAAEQVVPPLPAAEKRGTSKPVIIGGVVVGLLVATAVGFWAMGGFDNKPARESKPAKPADGMKPVTMTRQPPPRRTVKRPKSPFAHLKWARVAKPPKPVLLGLRRAGSEFPAFRHSAKRTCCAAGFDILETEVTWGDYEAWADGNPQREFLPPPHVPQDKAARRKLPVVGVTYMLAKSFCRELGGDLPTEEQHEYAARGPKLLPNPWGAAQLDPKRTAVQLGPGARFKPVCSSSQDVIQHAGQRVCDLAANALEWTRSAFRNAITPGMAPPGFPYAGSRVNLYRAVRGLPPFPNAGLLPMTNTSTYRVPGCVNASQCPDRTRIKQANYTGFRCVRPVK